MKFKLKNIFAFCSVKPLLDHLSVNETLEEENRETLKGFYGALKDADEYLKFLWKKDNNNWGKFLD